MMRLLACIALVLSILVVHFPEMVYSQSPNTTLNNKSHVSSSLTVEVRNVTISSVLANSAIGLLNSGPSVFKTSDSDKLVIKTQVINQINNATQNVEGIDASYAVIGIEVTRAINSIISPTPKVIKTGTISIETSSDCKPLALKSVTCDNIVKIK